MRYLTEDTSSPLDKDDLNAFGEKGWELCNVLMVPLYAQTNRVYYHYIFCKEDEE